ncbi:amidohydrolase [Colletotrichum karsti]|uniref:Amidohydrolase n=1 Tax=Colletotrichum karsti TaxID=1095194 RepID=A0A9P6IG68_9PEZI|nr:amidohydrolase [Colletotrichum karsti]KAF9882289.1 amidohydrolase [Colletotrichum karsti]
MTGKYIITGGHVVTLDDSLGDFENGAVLVDNGKIIAVGRAEDICDPDAELIDATEGVVIPGMVDCHRHASMSLTRGIGIDQHLWHFLSNTYTRWLPATGVEEMRTSALVGALEAIESGVTTIMDTCESFHSADHAEAELQGLKDSGIRGFFCYGMSGDQYGDVPAGKAGWEARMAHVERMAQEQKSQDGLVRVALHLSQGGTIPFSWTGDEVKLGQDLGMLCCSHTSAVFNSVLTNDLEVRADKGYMLPGHVYIHCTSVNDHEMGLIATTGGKIVLAPDTDIQMGMGYPPLRGAVAHGLKPALSIDTSSATPPDLLSQMRLLLQVQRGLDHNVAHLDKRISFEMGFGARDALIWGTRNGAEAVGLGDQIGTLTPGKRADIVILTSIRALSGSANHLGTAVLHSTPSDVDLVMIDGRIRKRDGKLVGVDVAAIRAKAREGLRRIQDNLKKMRAEMSPEQVEKFFRDGERAFRVNMADAYSQGAEVGDYLRA